MVELKELLSKPPFNILVDPTAMRRKRPWEIEIVTLLESFMEALSKAEPLDLRVCGSAVLSSAVIYRLKVETLFLFERLRAERRVTELGEPPAILTLPFRYQIPSTSIENLIIAFERILQELSTKREREKESPSQVFPEPILELDPFVVNITRMVEEFEAKLLLSMGSKGLTMFSAYTKGFSAVEAARTFILLLFLATKGTVRLEQVGDDIAIVTVEAYVT